MSDDDDDSLPEKSLTALELRNLIFSLLAWACTVSNVTLVVGSSAVVVLSIGGDDSIATAPLGVFFAGSSLVSLTVTPWVFRLWERKIGYCVGLGFGFIGTLLGCLSVVAESPAVMIVSSAFFGMAMGVGFYWRFSAVEVVPSHWASKAVTLVISGGCIAAFAGPESARATKDSFGDELLYLGVFVMTGVFNACNLVFTLLVQFPARAAKPEALNTLRQDDDCVPPLMSLLFTRAFLTPAILSGLTWAIMAMPMGLLRVAMHSLGYTSRQSLLTIELHFLAMYAPGFVSGRLIQNYGPKKVCLSAGLIFAVSLVFLFLADSEDAGHISVWIIGLALIGIGWNFGFTGATVWTTALYKTAPSLKEKVQAANDSAMFLIAGAWIVSASSVFEAGGGGLEGWRTLIKVLVGLLSLFVLVAAVDGYLEKYGKATEQGGEPPSPQHDEPEMEIQESSLVTEQQGKNV